MHRFFGNGCSWSQGAKKAARGIVAERFEAFGCAGWAARIKPPPLEAMLERRY